jgi:hypothetical protein
VERDGAALDEVEHPQVVEAVDVVGVGVGEEHGIDAADVVNERLLAEVGRGVDEERAATAGIEHFDQHAGAQPAVARVGRGADGAVAGDARHAGRGAGAEERDAQAHAPGSAAAVAAPGAAVDAGGACPAFGTSSGSHTVRRVSNHAGSSHTSPPATGHRRSSWKWPRSSTSWPSARRRSP